MEQINNNITSDYMMILTSQSNFIIGNLTLPFGLPRWQ